MISQADVALILWNTDVIDWVSFILLQQNLKCCGIEPSAGVGNIEALIASQAPQVIMFDLAPPYIESAKMFLGVVARFPDPLYVVTSADPVLALRAAPWLSHLTIVQKPFDAEVISKVLGSHFRAQTDRRLWRRRQETCLAYSSHSPLLPLSECNLS